MGNDFSKPTSKDVNAGVSKDFNADIFSLVWLDAKVHTSAENISAQEKLKEVINQIKTFEDITLCEQYIRSLSEDNRIIVMCSGSLGKDIVQRIHPLRQVFSIYIFCFHKETHERWSEPYVKVTVFDNLKQLIAAICSDQQRLKYNKVDEQLSISIFNRGNLNRETDTNDHFIYSKILIDCLLIHTPGNDKNELMSLCRTNYKGNNAELKLIREFEEHYYSFEKAIWWYTRDCFLYKMLNKALRVQDIDLLLPFRTVIQNIQYQLEQNNYSLSVPVYRGQLMSKKELQMFRNSSQGFILINGFLSAILNRKQALIFLNDAKVSNDVERVLFEIHADGNLDGVKKFNNIETESYKDQKEILFSIGSIFQLTDIRQDENKIFIIQMKLCSNDDPELKLILEEIKENYGDSRTSIFSFGLVAQEMKKFDEAIKYYSRLVKLFPPNHENAIRCQNSINNAVKEKQRYESGLKIMGKSVEDHIIRSQKNDNQLAFYHNNMGEAYRNKGDCEHALESYKKALKIWNELLDDDHHQLGRCYNSIGLMYQEMEECQEALEYYHKARPILEKHLSKIHPDLKEIYYNMGDMHYDLQQYNDALDNYIKCLEIAEQVSTSEDPATILLLNKIAGIYEKKKDFQLALSYYKKIQSLLPSTDGDADKNNENIQRVSHLLQ